MSVINAYEIRDAAGALQALHDRWETPAGKRMAWRLPEAKEYGLERPVDPSGRRSRGSPRRNPGRSVFQEAQDRRSGRRHPLASRARSRNRTEKRHPRVAASQGRTCYSLGPMRTCFGYHAGFRSRISTRS